MSKAAEESLMSELNDVAEEAEALLRATAGAAEAGTSELRAKLQASLDRARMRGAKLQDKARVAGRKTDEYVHTNPWQAIGLAAAMGLVVGLLIGRRQ